MKTLTKIIYRSILFTSPVWLFYIYLEYRLSGLENSYSYKIKNFNSIKDSCRVLILGNSEMFKGIDPAFLPQTAYNMAHVSQSYSIDEKILRKYITQMPKLKMVILGMSYISFGDDLENGEESWRIPFYKKYYELEFNDQFDLKDYSNTLRYGPYDALKMCLGNFRTDLAKGIQSNGWMKVEGSDPADLSDTLASQIATMHTKSLKEENVIKNMKALRSILSLLKEKNIKARIIIPPVMPNYSTRLDSVWIAKNDSLFNILFKEFGVDAVTATIETPNYFNDVNHLNSLGAKRYTMLMIGYLFGEDNIPSGYWNENKRE